MNEIEIKAKLDQLADFHAHRDLIESDKRTLLEDVKVPEEVQAIVKTGMDKLTEVGQQFLPEMKTINEKTTAELSEIVIPEEIKAVLAEIDQKRADIQNRKQAALDAISAQMRDAQYAIKAETDAQTADVYKAIEQRKRDIEAEFAGKREAVDANIAALEKEIKDAVKTLKTSVKASHFHAVYVSGRITWNTDKMEAWRKDNPFLNEARKEGEPSITLRRI